MANNNEKQAIGIEWGSTDGQVEMRIKYADGTVGPAEPRAITTADPEAFLRHRRRTYKALEIEDPKEVKKNTDR